MLLFLALVLLLLDAPLTAAAMIIIHIIMKDSDYHAK